MEIKELAAGFRKRTLVTAGLAGKIGIAGMKRKLLGASDEEKATDAAKAKEAAMALVRDIGALKGLVMKIGQMASYLPGALPDEAQSILAQLQSESVAMTYDRVAEVIRAELGQAPESLFDDFEEKPFAAASIGQVHRARFRDKPVAVKVQYPGIEDALKSDLSTIGFMTKMSVLGLPIDGGALVDELRERILEECDYALEAKNQTELGAYMRVPRVVAERSSRRVLTTELSPGMRFAELVATGSQSAKDRAGEIIFRTSFDCLFRHGVYNGDPHPGNYLFDEDGDVTFLDFGCVRRFDPGFMSRWKAFARGILDHDRENFADRFRGLGMVGREKGFDFDAQWEITQYLYRPFLQRTPFMTYTDAYVRESYGVLLFENKNQRHSAMPPEWLLLNRLQWGMNAVLAKLNATAAWPDHFATAVRS